jgi:hypothetical protein
LSAQSLDSLIEQFGRVWAEGKSRILEAAKIVCAIADADQRGIDKLLARYRDLSRGTIARLERIGRGESLLELEFDASAGAARLRELPTKLQQQYSEIPIPVVQQLPGGAIKETHLHYRELSVAEACRAISVEEGRIRSVAEQRKILQAPVKIPERFRFTDDGKVIFYDEGPYDAVQLEAILAKLKAESIRRLERDIKSRQLVKA